MADPPDLYRILQVDPAADPDVLAAAFRALARRVHPDRDTSGVQDERMAELNRAYAVLRDPDRRRAYDAQRPKRTSAVGPGAESPAGGGLAARMRATSARSESEDDGTRLDFGRYAGLTLRQVAARDREYLSWLARHSSGIRFRGEISAILGQNASSRS